MAGTPRDPYGDHEYDGDFEYDMVHEPGVGFEVPHEQHHDSTPPPMPDPGGDYGYDEAHDFGSG